MEEKNVREMTNHEILEEYDAKFAGARTYATKQDYEVAAMRKHLLKTEYESRQVEGAITQGVRTRRVL